MVEYVLAYKILGTVLCGEDPHCMDEKFGKKVSFLNPGDCTGF